MAGSLGVDLANSKPGYYAVRARGMIRFNLEDLSRLEFFDNTRDLQVRGTCDVLVTGTQHPYASHFWPPGHIIGYEHTFIATLADFLIAPGSGGDFHPNFEDALRVQRTLEAVEKSSRPP